MKRSYRPVLLTEEDKQKYFANLVTQINLKEYKEELLKELVSFLRTYKEFRQIPAFRRKRLWKKLK